MYRRPPYWILLIIAAALWAVATAGHYAAKRRLKPSTVATLIEKDLRQRVSKAATIDQHRADILAWLGDSSKGGSRTWVFNQPFHLFAWQADSLVAWSTNTALPPSGLRAKGALYNLQSGTYYGFELRKSWLASDITLSVLCPIATNYPFTNEYLSPSFAASNDIEPHTLITNTAVSGSAPLHAPDGRVIGYVHPPASPDALGPPSAALIWCWLLSVAVFGAWVHAMAAWQARKGRAMLGFGIIVITAFVIRGLMYWLGLPLHIGETALFSPQIYASSAFLPSLGDLLLNTLALLWIVGFAATRAPLKKWFAAKGFPAAIRRIISISVAATLCIAGCLFIQLIRSLVIDSSIPFDSTHLAAFDKVAIAGLLVSSLLAAILILCVRIGKGILSDLLPSIFHQAIAIIIGCAPVLIFYRQDGLKLYYFLTALWILFAIIGQHIVRLREARGAFRPANLFWSILHCLLLSLLVQHFAAMHELILRRSFAERIATRHDDALEYNFEQLAPYIRSDTAVLSFLRNPSYATRLDMEDRLSTLYFNNNLPAYQAHIYLFDANNRYLGNQDTTSYDQFLAIAHDAIPSRTSPELFYRESAPGDHIYLGILAVNDSSGNLLGTMVIDLEQKKIVNETVLPELLQPATINQAEKAAGYSYAVYVDRKVVAQTSNYPFPFYILRDTARGEFHERRSNDASTLIYTPDSRRAVYVWRRLGTVAERVTLFSFFLTMRLLLGALLGLWRAFLRWLVNPNKAGLMSGLSLRRRLQISMMGIVFLSFVMIGIITVAFLTRQYANTNKDKQQAMMQTLTRAIQQYMKDKGADYNTLTWEETMYDPAFRYFIETQAAAQKIDINLFDNRGQLAVATQQVIYDQGLLAPIMRPDVLQRFLFQPRPLMLEEEHIGKLRYISAYAPLRDEQANIAAYINVPLFYSQKELDEQISSIIVALINLYAITFLISSLLAVFITGWITRAFDIIIRQFGQLNLHGNELLEWPYDDEIGLLVKEYNKMVRKVEESVSALARTEREGAWREMARQVAHEIKNPLTPMKLHIQHLQNALRSGNPDALNLAVRVSDSILEQINNLSVIATEFSDFASIGGRSKDTEKSEEIDLSDLLRKVVSLYTNEPGTDIRCEIPDAAIPVVADRSQLVRIITNLMQNAVQAIPESRPGEITVKLHRTGNRAIVEVQDNGEGISEEAQAKLFTPYFTTKTSGTGLGLAMTRQMVEVWGGTITYKTNIGSGTTFTIQLPVAEGNN